MHKDDFITIDENNINDTIMEIENEIPINKSITVRVITVKRILLKEDGIENPKNNV